MFAVVVAGTFGMVALVFYIYDIFVQKRNENLVAKAAQSNEIVSSFVPDHLRERIMSQNESKKKHNLKSFTADMISDVDRQSKPLADLVSPDVFFFCYASEASVPGLTRCLSSTSS
jgi:hypothetical protein